MQSTTLSDALLIDPQVTTHSLHKRQHRLVRGRTVSTVDRQDQALRTKHRQILTLTLDRHHNLADRLLHPSSTRAILSSTT